MNKLNPQKIKQDFPILSRIINGKPLVYLDSAATTQKPFAVINAISDFYSQHNANIHRGVYTLAQESTDLYEAARKRVAQFLNTPTPESIVFTKNTTESINLLAHSWGRKFLNEGDEILLTEMEHHANFVPWYLLAKERGVKLKLAPITKNHELDLDAFKKLLTPKVKLVAVTAMSNVLGTIVPIRELTKLAHNNNSLIAIDGAQWTPHLKTDLQDIDCDFWSFSAHKMLGPTGVGVLYVKPKVLETMDPFQGGGEMISTVSIEETTWAEAPLKFEAGTSNYADVAVFPTAIDYLEKIGMDAIREHEKELVNYALQKLKTVPNITIYGPQDAEKQGGAISFNHNVIHPHDVGTILGDEGVSIRVGHHCAQPLMKALGVSATNRISFYIYNTTEDINLFIQALSKVDEIFGLVGNKK